MTVRGRKGGKECEMEREKDSGDLIRFNREKLQWNEKEKDKTERYLRKETDRQTNRQKDRDRQRQKLPGTETKKMNEQIRNLIVQKKKKTHTI